MSSRCETLSRSKATSSRAKTLNCSTSITAPISSKISNSRSWARRAKQPGIEATNRASTCVASMTHSTLSWRKMSAWRASTTIEPSHQSHRPSGAISSRTPRNAEKINYLQVKSAFLTSWDMAIAGIPSLKCSRMLAKCTRYRLQTTRKSWSWSTHRRVSSCSNNSSRT